jgi:hypothetical protein
MAEWEIQVDQRCSEKGRLMHEAGVAEKNRVDVQTQRDRKLKKGGRVTWMEAEAKELETVATKLCTQAQAENKEGAIKDEEALREASGYELSEVRTSSFLFICFTLADISPSLKLY